MLRFRKTKVAKEEIYGPKATIKIWDINVDNIVSQNAEQLSVFNWLFR